MNSSTRASILISTLAPIACFPTFASAQAPVTATPICPARYELLDGLCYNKTSGDIVLTEMSAATRVYTNANCPAGYTILLETLCFSSKTGDIMFAEDKPGMAVQAKR